MSFENNLSLDFLKKDNENLSKNGQDSSEGIVPSKEFEEVSVNQNGDGTWSKSSVVKLMLKYLIIKSFLLRHR